MLVLFLVVCTDCKSAPSGGQSINLTKFWEARKVSKSVEDAALSTFTGSKMKKLGFGKVRYISKNISENQVIVNFIKE